MVTAVYPGSFDPITNGHIDLIERAGRLFDQLIIGIAHNIKKATLFSLDERLELTQSVVTGMPNVRVMRVEGLLVDFARQHEAQVVLRGLRAVSDFEFEYQMAGMNRHLQPDIESLFLRPAEQFAYISSSLVKEVAEFGGDVSAFLTPSVLQALTAKLQDHDT